MNLDKALLSKVLFRALLSHLEILNNNILEPVLCNCSPMGQQNVQEISQATMGTMPAEHLV